MTYEGDNDGDLPMEDADPYNKQKYESERDLPIRPHHRNRPSQSQPYLVQNDEASAAARRYSPMKLSPSTPYTTGSPHSGNNSTAPLQYTPYTPNQSTLQSPTRPSPYGSNSQYASPCTSSDCRMESKY